MSSRYITNVLVVLFGGFVVVATRSFGPSAVGWIGFAFGITVVGISVVAQVDPARGLLQRAIDLGLLVLGGLTIAFGLAASGSTQLWTVFAFTLGWVALGFAGLTAHEIGTWRARFGLAPLHWFPTTSRERVFSAPSDHASAA
ncbi:MAG: hypothetical protein J2P58_10370 [Acidimicrobiaceae bacterium]|nr:hypothetical protein [Acidimicrobiaceae bacterium]